MLSFKEFLKKTEFLLESKLDEIKTSIARRHKEETGEEPDPAELHDVVMKAKGTGVNLSKATFNELKDKVSPGVRVLHHNPKTGVTIREYTKKKDVVRDCGHGKTNWCVAVTGKNNQFEQYSKKGHNRFFTVHHRPPDSPPDRPTGILGRLFRGRVSRPSDTLLGIHEYEGGTIRDINDKEVPVHEVHPDVLRAMSETEGMERSNLQTKNPHFGKEQLIKSMGRIPHETLVNLFVHHEDPDVRAAAMREGNSRDERAASRNPRKK
jgi:hypothetical protein